jgi:ABC-type dipeptide/oligopeptide/nickel transport system permease subunit
MLARRDALRLERGAAGRASCCWSLARRFRSPAATTCFGTDKVGQDVLYLTLKSIRTGLVIGTITTLVMLPFAVALGIAAGYLGGWVDDVIQYLYTTLNSIPGVLLIAAAVLMVQVASTPIRTGSPPPPSAPTRACWRCA